MKDGTYCDAWNPEMGSMARWVNHSKKPNAKATESKGRLYFIATCHINTGDEILVDYNPSNVLEGYEWATGANIAMTPRPVGSPSTRHTAQGITKLDNNNGAITAASDGAVPTHWAKYHPGFELAMDKGNRRGNRQYCYYDLTMGVDAKSCVHHPACLRHKATIDELKIKCPICDEHPEFTSTKYSDPIVEEPGYVGKKPYWKMHNNPEKEEQPEENAQISRKRKNPELDENPPTTLSHTAQQNLTEMVIQRWKEKDVWRNKA